MSIKIGIIRTSSIGDVVLATACLDRLQKIVPDAQVLWVGRKPTLSLINSSWPNLQVCEFRSGASRQELAEIKNNLSNCDAIIDLQTSFSSRFFTDSLRRQGKLVFSAQKSRRMRMRLVVSAFLRGRLRQLPSVTTTVAKYQYQMMLDALEAGLKALGISSPETFDDGRPRLCLSVSAVQDEPWWREMSFGCWLAVAPGASHMPKRAPTPLFRDILLNVSRLVASGNPGLGLVFVGSTEDRNAANELIDSLVWNGPRLNLAGKLTLDKTAILLSKSKALLSNDSGLAHIAEAVGVPVAVLFGPTVEAFGFPPWKRESRAHSSQVGCRPCSRHGKKSCRFGDQLCFHGIDSRAVARQLAGILGGAP